MSSRVEPDTAARVVVLDASVGVKWLKHEPGRDEALSLLRDHGAGSLRIVVPVIFIHEVLDVARRLYGAIRARSLWEHLERDDLTVVGIDAEMILAMLALCESSGCTFYDAAAPVLADILGVEFVSADRRAHGRIEGARIIG